MIKKSVFEDELIYGMQRELQSHDKKQGMESLVKAADYLHSAIEILEEAGLSVQADKVLKILAKFAADSNEAKENRLSEKELMKWIKDPTADDRDEISYESIARQPHAPKEEITMTSLLDNDFSDDLLNADIGEDPLEVGESDLEKTFEDSD